MKYLQIWDTPIVVLLAAAISSYFFIQPAIGDELAVVFFASWITGYILDAGITVRNSKYIGYERNILFLYLYCRFGPAYGVAIHFLAESAIVFFMVPFLFTFGFGIAASSVVALAFGVAHVSAYVSNYRMIRNSS